MRTEQEGRLHVWHHRCLVSRTWMNIPQTHLTSPLNALSCVMSGSGSHLHQGNWSTMSAILRVQNCSGTKKCSFLALRAAMPIHVCLPSRGPVGCLQLFATLQVVQKLWLFIRNVTVAYACFSFLFIWRPEALCCKLKLFSGFAPGCSAPFDSSVIFPSWSPALTAALFQPSPSTPFYFHITDHHAAQSLVGKISPHNPETLSSWSSTW